MKQIETDMEAETPDASMLMIDSNEHTSHDDTTSKLLSPELIQTLQSSAQLEQRIPSLYDLLKSSSQDSNGEFCAIRRAPDFNSMKQDYPLNYFEVNSSNTQKRDIQEEQRKDPIIRKSLTGLKKGVLMI